MSGVRNYGFIDKLSALHFVEEILLFGSRARGDNSERSDIDIALICPEATEKDWLSVLKIIDEADSLLKIDCLRFDKLAAGDKLRKNILNFGRTLYKRK